MSSKFDGIFTDYRTRRQKWFDRVKLGGVWIVLLMVLGVAFVGATMLLAPYLGYEVKIMEKQK